MRKKLFAILMSAMMMVTFMPAMAFAAGIKTCDNERHADEWYVGSTTVEFSDDFSTATGNVWCDECGGYVKDVTVNTTKMIHKTGRDAGVVEVTAKFEDGNYFGGDLEVTAYYIDITNAVIEDKNLSPDYVVEKEGAYVLGNTEITLDANGVKDYQGKAVTTVDPGTDVEDALQEALTGKAFDYEAYEEGAYDITWTVKEGEEVQTFDIDGIAGKESVAMIGTCTSKAKVAKDGNYKHIELLAEGFDKLNEKGELVPETKEVAVVQSTLSYDGKTSNNDVWEVGEYDGNDHAIKLLSKNIEMEFAITSRWNADKEVMEKIPAAELVWTSDLTVKDAGDYTVIYRIKNASTSVTATPYKYSYEWTIRVAPKEVLVGFVQKAMVVSYGTVKTPADILKVEGVLPADAAAFEDALAKAQIKGFFTTVGKNTLVISQDTYKAIAIADNLANNYTIGFNPNEQMTLVIEKAQNAVTCPTTNKTVKYSKVKKAAQKVTVKTTSQFGEVKLTKVSGSAKLKVQAGKIVVKKGTKKGTYKIKVRAYVADHSANYEDAKITKTITIRVK